MYLLVFSFEMPMEYTNLLLEAILSAFTLIRKVVFHGHYLPPPTPVQWLEGMA